MKAPDGLPPPLFAQPLLHWLANVISARASSELTTVEQALSLKPPKKGNFRIIEWDRHMIDRPVFPEWTRNGPTDKTRSPDSWSDEVSKWAKRAGLTNGTGLHAPRREALIKCNGTALDLSYNQDLTVYVMPYRQRLFSWPGSSLCFSAQHARACQPLSRQYVNHRRSRYVSQHAAADRPGRRLPICNHAVEPRSPLDTIRQGQRRAGRQSGVQSSD
ncbi:hypothetical protein VFPFJ_09777 [Purpureocillium lilacinum]|uniref:Uncharacterized protein n=1 Tax=Purpureocillium lilacinum TaxID=33203 RepID=A0A179GU77_PURLI|nr:hypothetical protein VFPFJ_09777 [Purpureocillium lilacinum]OAQ81322.1 hypothetical protein VFPFJ_09777 [Purpureocillium lilacinum]